MHNQFVVFGTVILVLIGMMRCCHYPFLHIRHLRLESFLAITIHPHQQSVFTFFPGQTPHHLSPLIRYWLTLSGWLIFNSNKLRIFPRRSSSTSRVKGNLLLQYIETKISILEYLKSRDSSGNLDNERSISHGSWCKWSANVKLCSPTTFKRWRYLIVNYFHALRVVRC